MPNVTDTLTNVEIGIQLLGFENPDVLINPQTSITTTALEKITEAVVNSILSIADISNKETLTNICRGAQTFIDPQASSIYASKNINPANGSTVVVTVTIANNLFSPVPGRTIKLHTNPSGRTGDNTASVTDSNGHAVFNVNSTLFGWIKYSYED